MGARSDLVNGVRSRGIGLGVRNASSLALGLSSAEFTSPPAVATAVCIVTIVHALMLGKHMLACQLCGGNGAVGERQSYSKCRGPH
ncbi:hypothetical protein FIBSPDRAFT_869418, partial [Athelia psychrophila]